MAQVMPGCEPFSFEGGDVGVLVLHGFTGNPTSMRPIADAAAEAGHSVEMPRLPGHGTTWEECNTTGWRDWAREVVGAYEQLRSRTRAQVAVGLSMGGTLALHLAETRGDDLAGIVTINPSIRSSDPRLRLLPLLKRLVPGMPGIGNDIAKPDADEKPYPKVPLRALHSFLELQRMVRDNLSAVTVPTLVFTSRQDHVVEPENGALVMEGIAAEDKEQVWLERSYHVATLDYDAPEIIQRTLDFTKRVTAG
jgi:carboxylesterase